MGAEFGNLQSDGMTSSSSANLQQLLLPLELLLAVHANPPWCSQGSLHLGSGVQSRIGAK